MCIRDSDNAPLIWVQVAISAGTTAYPVLSMHDESNGPLQGECIRHIRAAHNLYGGQTNPLQLYTGVPATCGLKSDVLSALAIPYEAGQGGWLPDVSFLENGAFAGAGWCLAGDGEAATEAGVIHNALNTSQQNDAGDYFSDANRANNFASALAAHLAEVKDFLDKLSDWTYAEAAKQDADRNAAIKMILELLGAAPMAGRLMLDAWFLPNLRKYGSNPNNLPDGTASNPYKWRPPDHVQKRFAEYMKRAEGFERTANKMAPRDEMLPTPTGKERLQQSGYYLTWPSIDQHDGRAMGGDKVANMAATMDYALFNDLGADRVADMALTMEADQFASMGGGAVSYTHLTLPTKA